MDKDTVIYVVQAMSNTLPLPAEFQSMIQAQQAPATPRSGRKRKREVIEEEEEQALTTSSSQHPTLLTLFENKDVARMVELLRYPNFRDVALHLIDFSLHFSLTSVPGILLDSLPAIIVSDDSERIRNHATRNYFQVLEQMRASRVSLDKGRVSKMADVLHAFGERKMASAADQLVKCLGNSSSDQATMLLNQELMREIMSATRQRLVQPYQFASFLMGWHQNRTHYY